jgi:hypothetical protein
MKEIALPPALKAKSLPVELWIRVKISLVTKRSPCILFIDELETLCGRRETLNQESEKRIVALFSNLIDEVIFYEFILGLF